MDNHSSMNELLRNGSNGSMCEIEDGFLAMTLPITYSIISVTGFFSNSLALWVFFFGTRKTNSITVYLKNLAMADLLLALCLPFRATYQNQIGPPILCKVVGIIFYLTMYVSIFLLSLISLDRYLKIIRPLQQYRIHTVPHSTTASRVVWFLCAGSMLPFFFDGGERGHCGHRCFHFKNRGILGSIFNMLAVATFFLLLLFFFYSYGKISLKLRAVALKNSKKTSTRAILKTFVVLAVFVMCFTPYHVVRVPYILAQVGVIPSTESRQALHLANEMVLCISALNCCFDPVIFFFLSSSFKRAMLASTHGKLKRALQKNQGVLNPRKSTSEFRIQRIELHGLRESMEDTQ
uniref:Probable G-protein coupled receptor 34 n=1 Tax=Anolis carolinensis TaxID=28377 RepID=H9GUP2_ANOCA|nr:PREDICTED: probable G-protein coupled receptor 34 [Anolis carolinensis]|eukprot:XP_008112872.1 PREDICTED: probable G-protein coupled receptor 34 [Anolis carolinensis]